MNVVRIKDEQAVYVISEDGLSLKFPGSYIEYISWIGSQQELDTTQGTPQKKLPVPVQWRELELLKRLIGLIVKGNYEDLEQVALHNLSLEELADVIKISHFLEAHILYSYGIKVFARRIMRMLPEFIERKDWIYRLFSHSQILQDIGNKILGTLDKEYILASLFHDFKNNGTPQQVSCKDTDLQIAVSGLRGEQSFCEVWHPRYEKIYDIESDETIHESLFCAGPLATRTDSTVSLYDLSRPYSPAMRTFAAPKGEMIWGMALSPNKKTLAIGRSNALTLWDLGNSLHPPKKLTTTTLSELASGDRLTFSADGTSIFEVRSNGLMRFWDYNSGKCRTVVVDIHHGPVVFFKALDTNELLTYANDCLYKWDSRGTLLGNWQLPPVLCCTGNGNRLVSAYRAGGALITLENERSHELPLDCASAILKAVYHPKEEIVATLHDDHSVCLWNAETGNLHATYPMVMPNTILSFSPDGSSLIISSMYGIRLWKYTDERLALYLNDQLDINQAFLLLCLANERRGKIRFDFEKDHIRSIIDSLDGEVQEALHLAGTSSDQKDERGMKLLHRAVCAGHDALVKRLLSKDVSPHARDNEGKTALHYAVIEYYPIIMRLLLEHGIDYTIADHEGRTALHYAALNGYEDEVRILLKYGTFLDSSDNHGWTPLQLAVQGGHFPCVKLLLSVGACAEQQDYDGNNALHIVSYTGGQDIAKLLLQAYPHLMESTNNDENTPLLLASRHGCEEVVSLLLSRGANVHISCEEWTPLQIAIHYGHSECVNLLIMGGAEINHEWRAEDGRTALHLAACDATNLPCDRLLEKGYPINAEDNRGWTALHQEIDKGNFLRVQYLVGHGADLTKAVYCQDRKHRIPVELAYNKGHIRILRHLIKHGAKPVVSEKPLADDWGAFQYAAASGDRETVEQLLRKGQNIDEKCLFLTALHYAAKNKQLDMISFLVQQGADINELRFNGYTALSEAAKNQQVSVVRALLECGAKKEGCSLMFKGVSENNMDLVRALLEYDVPVNECESGAMPVEFAVLRGNAELVRLLLEHGAPPDGNEGVLWPLYLATRDGHVEIVRQLLIYGADISKESFSGRTLVKALNECTNRCSRRKIESMLDKYYLRGIPRTEGKVPRLVQQQKVVDDHFPKVPELSALRKDSDKPLRFAGAYIRRGYEEAGGISNGEPSSTVLEGKGKEEESEYSFPQYRSNNVDFEEDLSAIDEQLEEEKITNKSKSDTGKLPRFSKPAAFSGRRRPTRNHLKGKSSMLSETVENSIPTCLSRKQKGDHTRHESPLIDELNEYMEKKGSK